MARGHKKAAMHAALDSFIVSGVKSGAAIAAALGIDREDVNRWILSLRDDPTYDHRGAVGMYRFKREYLYGYCVLVEMYLAWELRQVKSVRGKARRQLRQAQIERDLHPSDPDIRDSVRYWTRLLEDAEIRKVDIEAVALIKAW